MLPIRQSNSRPGSYEHPHSAQSSTSFPQPTYPSEPNFEDPIIYPQSHTYHHSYQEEENYKPQQHFMPHQEYFSTQYTVTAQVPYQQLNYTTLPEHHQGLNEQYNQYPEQQLQYQPNHAMVTETELQEKGIVTDAFMGGTSVALMGKISGQKNSKQKIIAGAIGGAVLGKVMKKKKKKQCGRGLDYDDDDSGSDYVE